MRGFKGRPGTTMMAGMVPRAILFDAGNTLVRINYEAVAAHLAGRGHRVTVEAVEDAELRARVRLDAALAAGASSESGGIQDGYVRYLLEPLGITDPDEVAAVARWRRAYNPPVGLFDTVHPAAARALARARAAGIVTGVVSNSNGSVEGLLARLGLGAGLAFVIDSAVVGVEKPDPRIFRLALARAGVEPGEAVYVGDLYSVDVVGARAAGMEGILLDPRGYWGPRDCATAPTVADVVALLLAR